MSLIPLPESLIPFLDPYLPNIKVTTTNNESLKRPFVTLTYAQSLDSKIAAQPGTQTKLSHLETKTMTHYLRSKHDAILVGIGTILADDPKLNCRYIFEPVKPNEQRILHQIRPVVIDPYVSVPVPAEKMVIKQGGKYIKLPLLLSTTTKTKISDNWREILQKLYQLGLKSIMIEGGAKIINDLLSINNSTDDDDDDDQKLIDSVIITIAPVFLGCNGVTVHPYHNVLLKDINWWTGIQDSIIAARIDYHQ
ncbi:RibD C-terminal domain family protein [Candida albicans]|uniref:2,5-diamino-6-ribosylamino-4(3H)-pyrimidinone 5'-phosphate reductase n=1 Tax=Candida albicans TaxID=5476 RepID=A0A8H6C0Z5_CANAX|nr:RibD C-terminal domain family protein [Candida albicans]